MPFNWSFLKIEYYFSGFERKIRRVDLILTKLSYEKNLGVGILTDFFHLRGLLDFLHFESRSLAYTLESMFIMGVLDVNLESGFQKSWFVKTSGVSKKDSFEFECY